MINKDCLVINYTVKIQRSPPPLKTRATGRDIPAFYYRLPPETFDNVRFIPYI